MGGVGKKKSTCNDIEYFVFGLFTDIRYRNDKEKFSFIRKQIKDLEDDGKTKVKFFTLVDATDSTREADNFLKKHFGELDNTKIICEFRVVPCYNDEGDKHLEADLANFRKRMLDCYSACCFSWVKKGERQLRFWWVMLKKPLAMSCSQASIAPFH